MTANNTTAAAEVTYRKWTAWKKRMAYLTVNSYLDAGSIAAMCQEVGITVAQHDEWQYEAMINEAEAFATRNW